jgi:hypothetical protein
VPYRSLRAVPLPGRDNEGRARDGVDPELVDGQPSLAFDRARHPALYLLAFTAHVRVQGCLHDVCSPLSLWAIRIAT